MRALGIDPGTRSYDLCCIEDHVDNVVLDKSIPTEMVARDPNRVFEIIKEVEPDVIVGPSGYGIEFKHISRFTEMDFALTTLDRAGDVDIPVLTGLRRILWMMREAGLNAYSAPGVVLLPTIPSYRKVNKIDMGTADKTCVALYAAWDQAEEYGIRYDETSLICIEMGFGYNAALAVERGCIIDGVGGTIFPGPSYLALGQMDGELAYILGGFSKLKLFEGGTTFIAAQRILELEDFISNLDKDNYRLAWRSFTEGVVKAVAMLWQSFNEEPMEIMLTGRLSRSEELRRNLEELLHEKFNVNVRRPSHNFAVEAKEAAQGAALMANGIEGGRYEELIEVMRIKEAAGTVFDHIFLPGLNRDSVVEGLRSS